MGATIDETASTIGSVRSTGRDWNHDLARAGGAPRLPLDIGRAYASLEADCITVGTARTRMLRIVVLNPKGGSGKTTIATNLASYYASRSLTTTLMDYDPQASCTRWLKKRQTNQPQIHGIAAFERNNCTTRSFQMRIPAETERVVVDTPAALASQDLPEITRGADAILVPVLPSDIDIHTCSKVIADLLLVAKIPRQDNRLGVIANRVKRHTLMYQSLIRFLSTLHIPIVATLRDSQNYIKAAELGLGIHEMKPYLVREDVEQWESLMRWIEERSAPGAERNQVNSAAAITPVVDANPADAKIADVAVAAPLRTTS